MKPVAIFRHSPGEGPGYFATFLERHSIPHVLIRVDAGDPVPTDRSAFSGLCFMGGPMSVNDPLPWIEPALALIRSAIAADQPVIGHCLGGQLMAKALGGSVTPNPVKEIGWGEVSVHDTAQAREWLGDTSSFLSFHWHGETFSLPPGASPLMASAYCANQGFVVGNSLGMQCHVEMTEAMIRLWNRQWADEVNGNRGASVQSPEEMYRDLELRLAGLNAVADQIYAKWVSGLRP